MDIAYARIMLLGTAGVGKTSLKRSLMREHWDPLTTSTIISEVHSIRPVGREWQKLGHKKNEPMKEVKNEDEVDEMAELLASVHQSGIKMFRSKVAVTELFHDEVVDAEHSDIPPEKVAEFKQDQVNTVLSEAITHANSKRVMRQDSKLYPFVHIWDCGGQPIFLEILPAFLTSRTMFLLLFDASKSLHKKWKSVRNVEGKEEVEEEVNMTTLDLILNWLSNIHIHLAKKDREGALLDYPRILCIGTHGDKLDDAEKENVIQEIKFHCKGKPFEMLIEDFYIVDNTTAGSAEAEDPNFPKIREKIYDFTSEKLIVKTPISCVLFRKVIQMLEANIISLKEAQAIGVACKIPPELVFKVLLFYHDLGVLLFYPHIKGLHNKVIISPRWFVDALGKVLTLQGREDYKTRLKWDLLREKGVLVQSLYVAAWREVGDVNPEALIDLLVHFCLATEVKTDLYHDPDEKQYFLPLVLPSCAQEKPYAPYKGYLQKATPIHLTFRTRFSPPGFFTRLITSIAKSPKCVIQFDKGVYRNQMYILFGSNPVDHAIFTELPQAIEVDILRYAPESDALDKFDYVCQELYAFLEDVAKKVDQCLFGNSQNEGPKVFHAIRYLCAGRGCSHFGPHYLKQAKHQHRNMSLTCERDDKHRYVLEEESFWFCDKSDFKTKKATKYLSEQEMLLISDKLSHDLLYRLAAYFNMIETYRKFQEDESKRRHVGLNFLHEWTKAKAGVRHELVEALKKLSHIQLARMVEIAQYDPEHFKYRAQSASCAPKDQAKHAAIGRCNTMPPTQQKSQDLEELPIIMPFLSVKGSSTSSVSKDEIDTNTPDIIELMSSYENTPLNTPSILDDEEMNSEHRIDTLVDTTRTASYEKSAGQETLKSHGQNKDIDITENDLLKCSVHIKKNLPKLAGAFGITKEQLNEIQQNYEDPSSQAYQLLLKCMEARPSTTRQDLKEKFEILKFSKAAQQLNESAGTGSCSLM